MTRPSILHDSTVELSAVRYPGLAASLTGQTATSWRSAPRAKWSGATTAPTQRWRDRSDAAHARSAVPTPGRYRRTPGRPTGQVAEAEVTSLAVSHANRVCDLVRLTADVAPRAISQSCGTERRRETQTMPVRSTPIISLPEPSADQDSRSNQDGADAAGHKRRRRFFSKLRSRVRIPSSPATNLWIVTDRAE